MIKQIKNWLGEHPSVPPTLTALWHFAYSAFNGAVAYYYRSYWFLTLSVCELLLGFMALRITQNQNDPNLSARAFLKRSALSMLLLSVVFSGLTILTIREDRNPVKNKILMIAIAAYTFILAGIAVSNALKVYREKTPASVAQRNLSCASTAGSMLSLERAMLLTFGDPSPEQILTIEAWSGLAVFMLLLMLTLTTWHRSTKLQRT